MYQTIRYEKNGNIGIATINRPEALNALNSTVISELEQLISEVEKDAELGAFIITGEGRSFVAGAELNGARNDKVDVLRYALQETGADVSHSLMVGDRFHDVVGGHAVGMKTVGVLYGYGSRQELEAVHADYICQSMPDLQTTLLALGAEMRH